MQRVVWISLCVLGLCAPAMAVTLSGEVQMSSRPLSDGDYAWCIAGLPTCVLDGACGMQFALRAQQTSLATSPYVEVRIGKRAGQVGTPYGMKLWVVTKDSTGHTTVGGVFGYMPFTRSDTPGDNWQCVMLNIWHQGSNDMVHIWATLGDGTPLLDTLKQVPGIGDSAFYVKRAMLSTTLPTVDDLDVLLMSVNVPQFTKIRKVVSAFPQMSCVLYPYGSLNYPFLAFLRNDCDISDDYPE